MMRADPNTCFKPINGQPVKSSGQVLVAPILNTIAGTCRLRNIKAYIITDSEIRSLPEVASLEEIFLGNISLLQVGLDVKDFIAGSVDRLSQLDYKPPANTKDDSKIGNLDVRLLTPDDPDDLKFNMEKFKENEELNICILIENGDLPMYDGDEIDYKGVEIGVQDKEELDASINNMITRGSLFLPNDHKDRF